MRMWSGSKNDQLGRSCVFEYIGASPLSFSFPGYRGSGPLTVSPKVINVSIGYSEFFAHISGHIIHDSLDINQNHLKLVSVLLVFVSQSSTSPTVELVFLLLFLFCSADSCSGGITAVSLLPERPLLVKSCNCTSAPKRF